MDFVISSQLYLDYNKQEEGFLSQKKSVIVGRKHLNLIGKELLLNGEIKNNLKKIPESVYGNTLESLIGAIYIDRGIVEAEKFIIKNIYNSIFVNELSNIDYKSELLKKAQKTKTKLEYRVLKKEGPDHKLEFLVGLYMGGGKITEAKAGSIKEAEQKTAKKAYNKRALF